ncbi:hypothetical protein IQ13_0935 [Lacibacter cauensis]|uniref:Succinate dehydrogenase / fumarate reductase cytochrome b subunit n=1 Tax=Lacibacter cauensis TaxID=510947 RepID=A0A562SWU3_9BACT|nr:hypothetical protein [Lacibacter cauensis]TWI85767.1 hypothetical protein IQ13_0935 [Lacibacter cauensis]
MKKLHRICGLILVCFVGIHLFNHLCSLLGADAHLAVMQQLRKVYRNPFVETVLLLAVIIQIISGLRFVCSKQKHKWTGYAKWQVCSGFYLAIFLFIHVGAVLAGRYLLGLDTNIYFGAAGLNSFPANLFFIPYYTLAIAAFFIHLAALHAQRMHKNIAGLSVAIQTKLLVITGVIIALTVLYGMTNGFRALPLPASYNIF